MPALRHRILGHRVRNVLHTGLILLAMGTQTALLGWLLWGGVGAAAAFFVAAVSLGAAAQSSPTLILRMYRARPLSPRAAPGLHRLLDTLTERARLPVRPTLYYIPSSVPNALSVGSRREPAVAVTDGLLRLLPARELVGVVAHEVGHIRNGDLLVMAVADAFARFTAVLGQMGMALLLFAMCLVDARFLLAGAVLAFGPTLATLLMLALSRQREYAADLRAVELTGDPLGLASALVRLEQPRTLWHRLVGLPGRDPNPSLLRTHPATEERLRRLRQLEPTDPWEPPHVDIRLPQVTRPPRWNPWGTWH